MDARAIEIALFGLWVVVLGLLVWKCRNPIYRFGGSAAVAAVSIGYSMYVHGLLPMGGIAHGVFAGVAAVALGNLKRAWFEDKREKK